MMQHFVSISFFLSNLKHITMELTNELSHCFQKKHQNIVRAMSLIGGTLDKLQGIRENG
jgi:hypothetical protein